MNNREYECIIETTTPGKVIVVSVYYDKGGVNYFSGTTNARGYYLSACPEERSNGMRMYQMFSGVKRCILPVARKGAKTAALAVNMALNDEKTAALVLGVAEKSGLTLSDGWKL